MGARMIRLIRLLRQDWILYVLGALALLLIVQTFRLQSIYAALEAERLGRTNDRNEYRRAQAEATAVALTAKLKKEAEYAARADEADTRYADLSGRYRAAVMRYQAARRAGGGTDLPGTTEAATGVDGAGSGAGIPVGTILIPQDDALICAENTARLQAAHEWAASLIANSINERTDDELQLLKE